MSGDVRPFAFDRGVDRHEAASVEEDRSPAAPVSHAITVRATIPDFQQKPSLFERADRIETCGPSLSRSRLPTARPGRQRLMHQLPNRPGR